MHRRCPCPHAAWSHGREGSRGVDVCHRMPPDSSQPPDSLRQGTFHTQPANSCCSGGLVCPLPSPPRPPNEAPSSTPRGKVRFAPDSELVRNRDHLSSTAQSSPRVTSGSPFTLNPDDIQKPAAPGWRGEDLCSSGWVGAQGEPPWRPEGRPASLALSAAADRSGSAFLPPPPEALRKQRGRCCWRH